MIKTNGKKDKVFPYSLTSVGPGANPGVQAVSPQVTLSHTPGGRLPSLSARPVVTSVAFTRWCKTVYTVAHVRFQLTTHLSTPKGYKAELAWLADLYRLFYPRQWPPVSCRWSVGQGKFAGQRPTFYHCAMQPSNEQTGS